MNGNICPDLVKCRPPGSVARSKLAKRAGRPPKPKSVSGISSGLKRRGRPPKAKSNLSIIPFAVPVAPDQPTVQPIVPDASVPNGSPRPRRRPKKIVPPGGAPPLTPTADGGAACGRERPRGVLPMIRAGRLQKLAVRRAKNPARRPVGRPKPLVASTSRWQNLYCYSRLDKMEGGRKKGRVCMLQTSIMFPMLDFSLGTS
ncbi:hypothetical protein VNO80_25046 [Phaseolus coccineus]|uniref:Uncharacterized protein n=1 Tax=Phaseolus coccineus TaxID=3886 RepID=A0AAN9LXU8_PHACN